MGAENKDKTGPCDKDENGPDRVIGAVVVFGFGAGRVYTALAGK